MQHPLFWFLSALNTYMLKFYISIIFPSANKKDCSLILLRENLKYNFSLKVQKNENFFGFDFEFCPISLLVMHK
jgi:hypothetical protein